MPTKARMIRKAEREEEAYGIPKRGYGHGTMKSVADALWAMVETYREGRTYPEDEPSMVYDAINALRSVGHHKCIARYGK